MAARLCAEAPKLIKCADKNKADAREVASCLAGDEAAASQSRHAPDRRPRPLRIWRTRHFLPPHILGGLSRLALGRGGGAREPRLLITL